MSWEAWLLFTLTEAALCVTPGPAVLLVLSQGLARGTRASVVTNLGILAGNTFYFALSATGLGAVLLASYELFAAIRWLGAAYLVWLGIVALRGRSAAFSLTPGAPAPARPGRMFLDGVALQISNPKALVFFTALLPQFIDPRGSVPVQVAVLAVTSVVIEFLVLLAYGTLVGRMRRLAARPRAVTLADRVAGSMLIVAGVGTAAIRRD
ncbi:MAG TPA: LysE family translocator [Methylomirabilota bacterium]